MGFPQEVSIKKISDKRFFRVWQFAWVLLLLHVLFFFGYFVLILEWLLLGAIINPTAFLAYASASATFITFVTTKYLEFKKLAVDGKKLLMGYIEKLYANLIGNIISKIFSSASKLGLSISNEEKLMNSKIFNDVTDKLNDLGIVDKGKVAEIKMKLTNFDPAKLGDKVIEIAKDPSKAYKELDDIYHDLVRINKW